MIVLDCSAVLAMCFVDEGGDLADELLDHFIDDSAVAPAIWPLEVCNALFSATKRKRLTKAESTHFFHLISALPVEVVPAGTVLESYAPVFELCGETELSAYDAAYLSLAMAMGFPIATLDAGLIRAANKTGTPLFATRADVP